MTVFATTSSAAERPWGRAMLSLAVMLATIGWLFRETAMVMAGVWWRSETFAHCMLVVPISLWLVWRRRRDLAGLTPSPQPWVLPLMLVPALVWLVAEVAVVNAAAQFAFVTLIILSAPAALGVQVTRVILFPLLFLYFAVPFGEFMLPTMMEWTADFTVAALRLSGVPVYREGQHFSIPSGNWSVIDECSGVRYVMASFLVGSLFAYLNYTSYRKRVLFMAVALVLPVFANWLRAYMIVMLAHLSGNRLAVGVDHILYGWVFFGVIVMIMFMVGGRWADPEDESRATATDPAGPVPDSTTRWTVVLLGAVLTAAAPHAVLSGIRNAEQSAGPVVLALPGTLSERWSSGASALVDYRSQVVNPSAEAAQIYGSPAGPVGLHVAYFRGQDKERKLVNSQHLLTGMRDGYWSLPIYESRSLQLGERALDLRSAMLLGRTVAGGQRAQVMVWRLYWIDGSFYATEVRAKLAGTVARLRGQGDEGALITLHADSTDPARAAALLGAFMQDNSAALNEVLAKVQRHR